MQPTPTPTPPPRPAAAFLCACIWGLCDSWLIRCLDQEFWDSLNSRSLCAGVLGGEWVGFWGMREAGIFLLREKSLPLLGSGQVDLSVKGLWTLPGCTLGIWDCLSPSSHPA